MKKLCYTLPGYAAGICLLLAACRKPAPADPKQRSLYFAKKVYEAFLHDDFETFSQFVPEAEYQDQNMTRDEYVRFLKNGYRGTRRQAGITEDLMEIEGPLEFKECNGEMQALFRVHLRIWVNGENPTDGTRLLYGFSTDGGVNWYYLPAGRKEEIPEMHRTDCLVGPLPNGRPTPTPAP